MTSTLGAKSALFCVDVQRTFASHMTRAKIYTLYIFFDLAIVAGVLWSVFSRWPVRQYLIPAAVLFVVNGIWLIVMTVRNTPKG